MGAVIDREARQRFVGGVAEGAVLGLVVSLVRVGMRLWNNGGVDALASHPGEVIAYCAAGVAGAAYTFGIGRMIASGVAGSLCGTACGGVLGVLAAASVTIDSQGVPWPLIAGAVSGIAAGAPTGAALQRFIRKRWAKAG